MVVSSKSSVQLVEPEGKSDEISMAGGCNRVPETGTWRAAVTSRVAARVAIFRLVELRGHRILEVCADLDRRRGRLVANHPEPNYNFISAAAGVSPHRWCNKLGAGPDRSEVTSNENTRLAD